MTLLLLVVALTCADVGQADISVTITESSGDLEYNASGFLNTDFTLGGWALLNTDFGSNPQIRNNNVGYQTFLAAGNVARYFSPGSVLASTDTGTVVVDSTGNFVTPNISQLVGPTALAPRRYFYLSDTLARVPT